MKSIEKRAFQIPACHEYCFIDRHSHGDITYNGADYLAEQVASLQAQTRRDWKLYICDDGSADDTPALLKQLAATDSRLVVLDDRVKGRGACGRFLWLLEQTRESHEIFFLCDQDDVWHPEKVERMARLIEETKTDRPLLVHCDLAVVDQHLKEMHASFFSKMRIDLRRRSTQRLAANNTVTGCACAFNKSLADKALPMPDFGIYMMHDWWLALVASYCGRILTIPDILVLYRQHGRNTVGAGDTVPRNWRTLRLGDAATWLSTKACHERMRLWFGDSLWRLQALQERFGGLDSTIQLLAPSSRRGLLFFMVRHRSRYQSPLVTLMMTADILRNSTFYHLG